MLFLLSSLLPLPLLLLLMMTITKGSLGAGTYFRIADFIGFKLTFAITDPK
jgi:hypothetical protein